ncbi:hypothetical protein [Litorilituus sediminis]|uniref:Uncharacterized protein n=1 Tax=Litorilituus sediminis TaxID=718192 RepID=A0A4P6P8J9_9GAMM|nr:hypothetical protein [Litorilituus sediminis]QBG35835.1 hypothetical protein EMK97_08965 [Litorilituus sediminis]
MNNVIQTLTNLASDASLDSEKTVAQMLANADITQLQHQAILANDVRLLAETINLPSIRAFVPVIVADEDETEQVVTNTTKKAVNA